MPNQLMHFGHDVVLDEQLTSPAKRQRTDAHMPGLLDLFPCNSLEKDADTAAPTVITADEFAYEFDQLSASTGTMSCESDEFSNDWETEVVPDVVELTTEVKWECKWSKCPGLQLGESPSQHLHCHACEQASAARKCKYGSCCHKEASSEHMQRHAADVTTMANTFGCGWGGWCTRRFKWKEELQGHLTTHAIVDASRLCCEWGNCTEVFSDVGFLAKHLLQHLQCVSDDLQHPGVRDNAADTLHKCPWGGCGFSAALEGDPAAFLHDHIMKEHLVWQYHAPERILMCEYGRCNRFFVDRTKFAEHIKSHVGLRPVNCTQDGCNRRFMNESQMRTHVKRNHRQRVTCEECAAQGIDRSYTTAFNLLEHQKVVHENKEYTCPQCSRNYKSSKAFQTHKRNCGGEQKVTKARRGQARDIRVTTIEPRDTELDQAQAQLILGAVPLFPVDFFLTPPPVLGSVSDTNAPADRWAEDLSAIQWVMACPP